MKRVTIHDRTTGAALQVEADVRVNDMPVTLNRPDVKSLLNSIPLMPKLPVNGLTRVTVVVETIQSSDA